MKTDFRQLNNILKRDKDFLEIIKSIRQKKILPVQKAKLYQIISVIETKLPQAETSLINTINIIKDSINRGILDDFVQTQVQHISSIILAGAAITRNDLPGLRPDLSPNVFIARMHI